MAVTNAAVLDVVVINVVVIDVVVLDVIVIDVVVIDVAVVNTTVSNVAAVAMRLPWAANYLEGGMKAKYSMEDERATVSNKVSLQTQKKVVEKAMNHQIHTPQIPHPPQ